MALWKRNGRYWSRFSVNGLKYRKPLIAAGALFATTNWKEATQLERELIAAVKMGAVTVTAATTKTLFAACDDYLAAKAATAGATRTVAFDRERLAQIRRGLQDVKLSLIGRETIETYQRRRRLEGRSNRTVNMEVGVLRQVLKRFGQWKRLEDHVSMLTEAGGPPKGRALTAAEQQRLLETAAGNPEWEHIYCAAVLAANTSMRGVEVKHLRRGDVDLARNWEHGTGVVHIRKSKNETSRRVIPLNDAARDAVERMLARADRLGHGKPLHYLWCASQHQQYDPTQPTAKWDTAWRALRDAAGLKGLRFHDLRHTVITNLLEAGVAEHVVASITGQLSKRMLEHYSHQRVATKGAALNQMEERSKA